MAPCVWNGKPAGLPAGAPGNVPMVSRLVGITSSTNDVQKKNSVLPPAWIGSSTPASTGSAAAWVIAVLFPRRPPPPIVARNQPSGSGAVCTDRWLASRRSTKSVAPSHSVITEPPCRPNTSIACRSSGLIESAMAA